MFVRQQRRRIDSVEHRVSLSIQRHTIFESNITMQSLNTNVNRLPASAPRAINVPKNARSYIVITATRIGTFQVTIRTGRNSNSQLLGTVTGNATTWVATNLVGTQIARTTSRRDAVDAVLQLPSSQALLREALDQTAGNAFNNQGNIHKATVRTTC